METVLVVEDDESNRFNVCYGLRKEGYETLEAANGKEAVELFDNNNPALVILDIEMPLMDGIEASKKIRSISSSVPILFLSVRAKEIDRVLGLELGDDYLTKPYSLQELVVRVKNLLRHVREPRENGVVDADVVERGRLRTDRVKFKVYWGDKQINLTPTQFNLLRTLLIGEPDKVFSFDELIHQSYPRKSHSVSDDTIRSHIKLIRKKLKKAGAPESLIETVWGAGYRLGSCD